MIIKKSSTYMIVFVCIILIFTSCNNLNTQNTILNENTEFVERELLSKTYFEIDSIAFFNWDTLYDNLNNNFNIYNACWILDIYNILEINIQGSYKEKLILFIQNLKDNNLENKSLHDTLRIAMIEKNILGEIKDSKIYEKKILEFYDKNQKMFF